MFFKILKNWLFLLNGVDIVISHAPPKGIHDVDDRVHEGFSVFNKLIKL